MKSEPLGRIGALTGLTLELDPLEQACKVVPLSRHPVQVSTLSGRRPVKTGGKWRGAKVPRCYAGGANKLRKSTEVYWGFCQSDVTGPGRIVRCRGGGPRVGRWPGGQP